MPTPKAVANYGLEMLDTLRKASRAEVRLPIATEGLAINMRQSLYSLRAAMRRENHYMLPVAEQVTQSIERSEIEEWRLARERDPRLPEEIGFILVVSPVGADFAEALKAAGIETDIESILDPTDDLEESPLTDPMTAFMKED